LEKPAVVMALNLGMGLQGDDYKPGDPPWEHGRGTLNGQRAKEGCLSWYQPWGRCHYIAPFSWAIGRELFPDLNWGFITSDPHTVAIGYRDDWRQPEWVMDILLFRKKTADESLAFAQSQGWKFYRSLSRFAASFFFDPEHAEEKFLEVCGSLKTFNCTKTIFRRREKI
jgi:hypothetical protein